MTQNSNLLKGPNVYMSLKKKNSLRNKSIKTNLTNKCNNKESKKLIFKEIK